MRQLLVTGSAVPPLNRDPIVSVPTIVMSQSNTISPAEAHTARDALCDAFQHLALDASFVHLALDRRADHEGVWRVSVVATIEHQGVIDHLGAIAPTPSEAVAQLIADASERISCHDRITYLVETRVGP